MATCPTTSMYDPSSLVSSFHNIPHVDIDLNPSPDSFELTLSYFQAVIIWACVPILIVVCLFILMSVYFICVCCCCCCQSHDKRSKASKGVCGTLVVLLVLLSLGMVGVAFWSEYELDQNILQSFDSVRNATDIMQDLRNTTTSYSYDTSGNNANLMRLRNNLETESNAMDAVMSTSALITFNQILGDVFGNISNQALPIDFGNIDPVFVVLDLFEIARHWAVFAYLIVMAIFLLLVALSVCFSACCRNPACMVIMMVVFFFATFVMWVAVGANLAFLVVSGDICFSPDSLIRNFTTQLNTSSATPISNDLLDYYLICNQTCYSSPFQPYYDDAEVAFSSISSNENVIRQYFDQNGNPGYEMDFNMAVSQFSEARSFFGEVESLTDCTVLNTEYLNILTDLCTEGYLHSVVLFVMACSLAVFMVLIIMCGSFYAGLLSDGRGDYDDETVVYDFPSSGASPWDSYGTQQHYTARTENIALRESPQPVSDPPKYQDLSGYHPTSAQYTNGAQFASDGTVDVSIRPANGGGDIDLGEPLHPQ